MRPRDTVLRMRDWLLDRGVELTPGTKDARAVYEGDGHAAVYAWQAFRAVAIEPAYDSVGRGANARRVRDAGFLFEGIFSPGWPKNPHSPHSRAMPEHYELMFRRQFSIGEDGDMKGLGLTIFVPAADELRELQAVVFSDEGSADAEITKWLDAVEADPAFRIPMTRHPADRFSFGYDDIG
jgi:hypothetical protein